MKSKKIELWFSENEGGIKGCLELFRKFIRFGSVTCSLVLKKQFFNAFPYWKNIDRLRVWCLWSFLQLQLLPCESFWNYCFDFHTSLRISTGAKHILAKRRSWTTWTLLHIDSTYSPKYASTPRLWKVCGIRRPTFGRWRQVPERLSKVRGASLQLTAFFSNLNTFYP